MAIDQPLRRSPRAATIYDVAAAARVSHQTVSRYLRGFEGIRPETRERVEAAIAELSYRPNLTARSLATSRSHRIAALTHEMLEVGPSKVVAGAAEGAREAGYLLDIVALDPADPGAIARAVGLMNQPELAGILAFAPTDALVAAFARAPLMVPVLMDSEPDERDAEVASTLSGRGVELLVEHLAQLGHRRFFHVGGPVDWVSARNRETAWARAVEARGLTAVGAVNGAWSSAAGYTLGRDLPLDSGVTAVVAGNDQVAIGVIRALSERGMRVPDDISVVGFDDIPEARYLTPALTTVSLDFALQGRVAIGALIAQIEGRDPAVAPEALLPELRARESSGPVAARA